MSDHNQPLRKRRYAVTPNYNHTEHDHLLGGECLDQPCYEKAPGQDNGMYDVLCSLPLAHEGDHIAESARWSR